MPLVILPTGQVVDVAEGAGPDVIRKIAAQQPRAKAAPAAPVDPDAAEVSSRVRKRQAWKSKYAAPSFTGADRGLVRGFLANFDDEIGGAVSAGTRGVVNAVRKRDIGEIGREYRLEKKAIQAENKAETDASPNAALVTEIAGSIVNPLGTGARVLGAAAKGANAVRSGNRVARGLTRASNFAANRGTIGTGVLTGVNTGALNAAGVSDNNVAGDAVEGAVVGGGMGGALGGVIRGGTKVIDNIRNRSAEAAPRVAYERIADLLDKGGKSPQQAVREIGVTDARGGDAMVMDLTPGLRAQAGALSRRTSVPSSNAMIERGEARIGDRPTRFTDAVEANVDTPRTGVDSFAQGERVRGARKARGEADYAEGGAMDKPLKWDEDLDFWLSTAPKQTQSAMRNAYDDMLLRRESPGKLALDVDGITGAITFKGQPNLRTFDYVKRGFDTEIGKALKAGDKSTAQGLSQELKYLKDKLIADNPEYGEILRAQRDLFQQEAAIELGESVLKRISNDPRAVLRDLQKLSPDELLNARTGVIDRLVNMDNKANPVAEFLKMVRNEDQRKIMEIVFGGAKELKRFQRFIRREVRSTRADLLTAPGRQSETARFAMADDDATEGARDLFIRAFKGQAFGGPAGAISGLIQGAQNLSQGVGKFAQEEIAKILMSKGEGLVEGVTAAKKYAERRTRRDRRYGRTTGKVAAQTYSGYVAGE